MTDTEIFEILPVTKNHKFETFLGPEVWDDDVMTPSDENVCSNNGLSILFPVLYKSSNFACLSGGL